MNTKIIKRSLCWLVTLLLLVSMAVITAAPLEAQAAGNIKVKIANVSRRYNEANNFLAKINAYRSQYKVSALVMDSTYLENAMIRAAELSLYMDLNVSPNGSYGTRYLGNYNGGHLIGYDVRSMDALLTDLKNTSQSYLLNGSYRSVGVGDVSVNGYKYVCVLMSDKAPSPASDTVLAQSSVTVSQEVETKPEYLNDITSPYSAGYSITCGGNGLAATVRVKNQGYPTASAFLTSYGANVTFSNPNSFELKNERVYAVSPGTGTMTFKFPGSTGSASCTLTAVGQSFDKCTFDAISDQVYTGKAITPKVVIRNSEKVSLVNGTDYEVKYANNINVGTATVTVTGKGNYAGESKTLTFKIVKGNGTDSLGVTLVSANDTISVGESVKLTAAAQGGTAPFKYTFSYAPYGSSSWTDIVANTTNTSCTFTPKEGKTYLIRVIVTDSKGLTAQQSIMLIVKGTLKATSTLSPQAAATGGTVKITTTISGGTAPVQVGYYIQKPSSTKWVTLQDYSTATSATFRPMSEGTYQICVKAKDRNDTIVKQYLSIKATASTLVNKSAITATAIDMGASVTLKGAASGGTTPYVYAYYYKKSAEKNWHTFKDYSTATSYTFKPGTQTTYNFCIKVKDAAGTVEKKYVDVVVYPELVNNSSVSAASINVGQSVTLKGAASGGKSGYQYSYWYRPASSKTYAKIKDFSAAQSVSFTPKSIGKWYFRIKVKDATGRIVSRDVFVDVSSTLANKSTVSAASVATGKNVTVNFSASGGTTPYQYALYYCKPGSTSYTRVSDYTTKTSYTVTLGVKGTYTIRVKVKDAAGTVINKDLTVKTT